MILSDMNERINLMYSDKIIICKDCGEEFNFSAGEQLFFEEKGFNRAPVRCKSCRKTHRTMRQGHRNDKVIYEIVCAKCGEVSTVNFEPSHEKPVYCNECYRDMHK